MKNKLLSILMVSMFAGSSLLLTAQTYVGSEACKGCHSGKYNTWIESGHPFKFNVIQNNTPPEYPNFVVNYQDKWMDSLGDGSHTWADVAGVIGGFGWKTRFVGQDGIIIGTASSQYPDAGMGHNQHNFFGGEDLGWSNYEAAVTNKKYNYKCFQCHTTGGDTASTWLPAVPGLGTFTEQGIGCEACHGPGSAHVDSPSSSNIDKVYEYTFQDNASGGLTINGVTTLPNPNGNDVNFLCGTCHNRSFDNAINAKNGFVEHHEQWDEFTHTGHFEGGMDCSTCHDPHKRVLWDGDGIIMECSACHSEQVETTNHGVSANCIDCHMPYSGRSGAKLGKSGYRGDVRSHLVRIIPDTANMFTPDGKWVRNDAERPAALSPAFSCLGCHNNDPDDDIQNMTIEQAAAAAVDMHGPSGINNKKEIALGIFPNPSSGVTKFNFSIRNTETVSINIYSISGQLVYTFDENTYPAGTHTFTWEAESNIGSDVTAGYYLVKLTAGDFTTVKKLILID